MPRTATVWLLLLLASPWSACGQETDSLFFSTDSLHVPAVHTPTTDRPGVNQRRSVAEPFMQARVHFTGDFIRRFNDLSGNEAQRRLRIRSLFDAEDPRLTRGPGGEQNAYGRVMDQCIEDICADPVVRAEADLNEQLFAEVLGQASWQHQEHAIRLYLRKHRTGTGWAWEIIGVETDFPVPPVTSTDVPAGPRGADHRDSLVFIPPNAHELNFMGLARQLRAAHPLTPFISAAVVNDTLLAAVSNGLVTGQLRWQTLLRTTLWLNTQCGWLVQLRQFNRETDNSGWLISNVCRLNGQSSLPAVLRPFIAR